MPYGTKNGRYVHTEDVGVASAVRTVTGQSAVTEVGGQHTVRALLDVTAASGTAPTLNVTLQTSNDGSTGWRTVKAFAEKSAVSSERISASDLDRFVRWNWAIAGTGPSFTFSLTAELV